MLYKNWKEICKIENAYFLLAVALATDIKFLGDLAIGFPHLFTDIKPEHPGPFPLSFLRKIADSAQDIHSLDEIFLEYGLPAIPYAHRESFYFRTMEERDEKPVLWMGSAMSQEEYNVWSEKYTAAYPLFPYTLETLTIDDVNYYVGYVNTNGPDVDELKDMYLYPTDLVDVNT